MTVVSQFSQFRAGLAYRDPSENSDITNDTYVGLVWNFSISERDDLGDWFEVYDNFGVSPPYWVENRNLKSGIYAIRLSVQWQSGFAGTRHIGCDVGTFANPTQTPLSVMGSVGNMNLEVGGQYDQFSGLFPMQFANTEGVARFMPTIKQFNGDTQFINEAWSQFEMYHIGSVFFSGVWHS